MHDTRLHHRTEDKDIDNQLGHLLIPLYDAARSVLAAYGVEGPEPGANHEEPAGSALAALWAAVEAVERGVAEQSQPTPVSDYQKLSGVGLMDSPTTINPVTGARFRRGLLCRGQEGKVHDGR